MSKRIITRIELQHLMTEEFQNISRSENFKFGEVYKLMTCDEIGCNWSLPTIKINDGERYMVLVNEIVKKYRTTYNID